MADKPRVERIPQPSSPAERKQHGWTGDELAPQTANTLHPDKADLAEIEPGQAGSLSDADQAEPREA